ncbi:MAG: 2-C-methyl-D-erythritol 2,4-cyclodiphosphate synthase [Verrucomicrobia bacterium]|nr:2-C-methyl-D-erythritol 2,4-cyclodiphosphate synthase [Verrucomicrobiota bacterium]
MSNPGTETSLPPPFRVGLGYDIHRFAPGRRLVLGGVEIAHADGLDGHSDADVVLHALADAILGALGLPDIGHYFPPSDPQWHNLNSMEIVRKAVGEANARNWAIGNVDIAVIAEKPKLAPHIPAMRKLLATSLRTSPDRIGIKATTNEKLGDLGKGLGIAAHAVVLLWHCAS